MNDTLLSLKDIKVRAIDIPCGDDCLHIKLYSEAMDGEIRMDTDDGTVVYAYDELRDNDTLKLFMDYFNLNGLRIEYSSNELIDDIDHYLFLGLILLINENKNIEGVLSHVGLEEIISFYKEKYR